jgi:hypothetical protein
VSTLVFLPTDILLIYFFLLDPRTIRAYLPRHFLIPWSGGAFAPLGPFLCLTTEERKRPIAPKPGP